MRLELALKAVAVPYFGASGYVGVFEWSPTGGMVHLHYILWKRDAPRFDVRAEVLEQHAERQRKAGFIAQQVQQCKIEDAVDFSRDMSRSGMSTTAATVSHSGTMWPRG